MYHDFMVTDLSRSLETSLKGQTVDPNRGKLAWREWRQQHGLDSGGPMLTEPGDNYKLAKSQILPTFALSLAQAETSGVNVCPFSTAECRAVCVATSGNGAYPVVGRGRKIRTDFFVQNPVDAVGNLIWELNRATRKYGKIGVRLNAFSDLRWERIYPEIFSLFADSQFYDYTKWPVWTGSRQVPGNYHLTWSYAGNQENLNRAIDAGYNAAVVFSTKRLGELPAEWNGLPVVDGDKSDERWTDPAGSIVGLRAKGRAQSKSMDFVVNPLAIPVAVA
jgi:hypothetical protein